MPHLLFRGGVHICIESRGIRAYEGAKIEPLDSIIRIEERHHEFK